MKLAPDEQSSPSIVKLRVDRYALADIASNKDVLSALLQISFSINGIRTTNARTRSSTSAVWWIAILGDARPESPTNAAGYFSCSG